MSAPAVKATLSRFAPATVAAPIVGASGTFAATTLAEALDAPDVPAALVAVTEHLYAFVAVKPVTTIGDEAPLPDPPTPPSLDTQLAEKLVIAAPLDAPAANDTLNRLTPVTVAAPIVGAAGASAAITLGETLDGADSPRAFVAVTEQV